MLCHANLCFVIGSFGGKSFPAHVLEPLTASKPQRSIVERRPPETMMHEALTSGFRGWLRRVTINSWGEKEVANVDEH
jgi:hypothetical protein